ncbi:MAG: energy transducer TonB [Pyrinomonadaceae bacterium]
MRFSAALVLIGAIALVVSGQRPRAVDPNSEATTPVKAAPPPAPETVKAKYEGGVLGYGKKQDGTLVFDDANNRLVFKDKHQKELFPIPYAAVAQAFADTQARRPAAASVISAIPVPYGLNLPARFIKKKYQYLTLQFYDDDSHVGGVTSFKLANKALVASVVNTLANKAGLVPRGDVFVRQRSSGSSGSEMSTRVGLPGQQTGLPEKPKVFVENESLSNRVISLPRPVYPEEARASRAAGTVRVIVTIDEEGKVADAEAISGPSILQAAAVEAARKAIFEPVLKEGQPVKAKTVIAYSFQVS